MCMCKLVCQLHWSETPPNYMCFIHQTSENLYCLEKHSISFSKQWTPPPQQKIIATILKKSKIEPEFLGNGYSCLRGINFMAAALINLYTAYKAGKPQRASIAQSSHS